MRVLFAVSKLANGGYFSMQLITLELGVDKTNLRILNSS